MITRRDTEKQIYIVSYPRSGNTWMRFLLMAMLYPDVEISFPNVNRLAPDAHQKRGWIKHKVLDPLVLKSHLQKYPAYYVSKNIYLYRDPRDVAVSFYYFKEYDKEFDFREFIFRFAEGEFHMWTPWACHVCHWLFEDNKLDFVSVKYEDLLFKPEETLKRIMKYLNIKKVDSSDKAIAKAIKKCEFKNLVARARKDGLKNVFLGTKARAGYWKEYFEQDMLNFLWKRFGDIMEKVGYEKGEIKK